MRLTNELRDTITRKEFDKKFSKPLFKAEEDFKKAIEKQVKKNIPRVSAKLEPYINTGNKTAFVDYKRDELRQGIGKGYICLNNALPLRRGEYEHKVEMKDDVLKAYKEFKKLHKESKKFRKDLSSLLYSVTTDKKLLAIVPELKPYFQDTTKAITVIPDEQIKKVRKSLGGK